VAADPEAAWALIHEWIGEAATPEEAELYRAGLRALLVDEGWRTRLAAAADDDPRLAHCVADAVEGAPDLFHDLISRDRVMDTWIRYQAERSDWDFWAASLLMDGVRRWDHERMWSLIVDLAERTDDSDVLAQVGISLVESLVYDDWRFAISRIERDAPKSAKLRRALWSVWKLSGDGIPDDITARIHRAADQPPCTPHRY
jgi:hypothetical protein